MTRVTLGCVGFAVMTAGYLHVQAARPHATSSLVSHPQTTISQASSTSAAPRSVSAQRGFLEKYCVACHNERLRTAGLILTKIDLEHVGEGADAWEKVVRKLRARAMPPPGAPRPDHASYESLTSWLEAELDRAATIAPNPGRRAVHRLNRVEYGNAIRDLLGLDVDSEALLPPDDEDQGFDNIAAALSVSPTLMERYMYAARQISQLAVGDPDVASPFATYNVPESLVQDDRTSDELPFGSRGGAAIRHYFPLDGEYSVKIRLRRTFYDLVRGVGNVPHTLDLRVDGVLMKTFSVGGEHKGRKPPASHSGNALGDEAWEVYSHHADDGLEVRIPIKAGMHVVGVSFLKRPAVPEGVLQPTPMLASFGHSTDEMMDGNPAVRNLTIGGPFAGTEPRQTRARQQIFVCHPTAGQADEEERCARRILSTLSRRAYRRPVVEADVKTLFEFYESGRRTRGFDGGIQEALERLLVDPEFLFRFERDPAGVSSVHPISDIELASRLSFFLWSSIPDDELLQAASDGKLRTPSVLEQQVRRMLADGRSKALVTNFAAQWLQLRQLRNAAPDLTIFPDFDENLRDAMQSETELFIESQLRDDRSVVDLLRADYTFVNERLARHYRIPDVYGTHFRRIPVKDDRRIGLLGQASLLTLTSYPNRTSPVLRGKWVLENLLGAPPPPPPPNVPALRERSEDGQRQSLRERMEQHRQSPACAVCHKVMDPLGFALENFDAIGKWRVLDETGILDQPAAGAPNPAVSIDPGGVLPDGTAFAGPAGLRKVLVSRQEEFVGVMAERLLMYALGRPVDYYDMPTLRRIMKETASADHRWSSLVIGIVKSVPFQMRRSQS